MKTDPAIREIRAVRKKISARYGHNTRKLVQHYIEYQKQFAGKLIPAPRKACIA